jgi:hypothetical protein
MILITSANYINQELQNEFGKIPPAFLPLKNKRLYEHYNYDSTKEQIFISIPLSYNLDPWDEVNLKRLGYKVIYIDEKLNLGESVANAISLLPGSINELKIIHGDAYFYDLTYENDCFIVSHLNENYNWGIESKSGLVYTGYFAINKLDSFLKLLIISKFEFILAVELYKKKFSTPIIQTKYWLDFGHLSTYYKSKSNFTTERSFNELKILNGIVTKSGINFKMKSEVLWFKNLPSKLRIYTPKLIDYNLDDEKYNYRIEYKHLSSLNELFVFGALPLHSWKIIFKSCFDVLSLMSFNKIKNYESLTSFVYNKTEERVKDHYPFDLDEKIKYKGLTPISLNEIISSVNQYIEVEEQLIEVMHGDFCLSNLLFDFRNQQIQMIDPRGSIDGTSHTINGFLSYDLAKFTHSILGLYDFIVADRFDIIKDNNEGSEIIFDLPKQALNIQSEFYSILEQKNVDLKSIMSICIHLFISMIPLHNDSSKTQQGFYLNIFRLYKEIIEYDSISNGRKW